MFVQLFTICLTVNGNFVLLQYTDWEQANNGYMYQKMVADVVGDYFFICPSIHFAQLFADRGMKVYYYFFTQVGGALIYRHVHGDVGGRPIDGGPIML